MLRERARPVRLAFTFLTRLSRAGDFCSFDAVADGAEAAGSCAMGAFATGGVAAGFSSRGWLRDAAGGSKWKAGTPVAGDDFGSLG